MDERHAELGSWARRITGFASSELNNGISSHTFSGLLTTEDVDNFSQMVQVTTGGANQGCIASDRKRNIVLSSNVRKRSLEVPDAPQALPTSDSISSLSSSRRSSFFMRSHIDEIKSATSRKQNEEELSFYKSLDEKGMNVSLESKTAISQSLVGLRNMRGPSDEVITEGTSLHVDTNSDETKEPRIIVLVRLTAGTPISISRLRMAIGPAVWADGTFRTVPLDEVTSLEKSLPATEMRAQAALEHNLAPLVAGFNVQHVRNVK